MAATGEARNPTNTSSMANDPETEIPAAKVCVDTSINFAKVPT